jgi:hypothetical protein
MNFEDLPPEQQEKARACKTKEELAALAEEEGFQLSDDELEGIAGGELDRKKCRTVGCPHYGCQSYEELEPHPHCSGLGPTAY